MFPNAALIISFELVQYWNLIDLKYVESRGLNMFDPFLIEYLLGNLNKKITAIIIKFIKIVSIKLEIFI